MLWTDKYRPKTFDDVVGNVKQKAIIQKWVEKWKNGEPQPPLLLIGPAGTGKTTIAHIIADEFSEYIELNASDKRSHDLLMVGDLILSILMTWAFFLMVVSLLL